MYGIIEVKSILSKSELIDAAKKIETFKRLAPRDLSVVQTRDYVTVARGSRPFGIVFGCRLGDNSLDSLRSNLHDLNMSTHNVNYFVNLVCVLNVGLLWNEKIDLPNGEKKMLLDTDEFVDLVLIIQKRRRNGEAAEGVFPRIVSEGSGELSFGRCYVYLLIMLLRMRLNTPDLALYLDPTLGNTVIRES